MRHLFGKEHKEHKSMKLVKKLQLEEDKKWQQEQQRRLEQEEKDEAFARELQDQMSSDEPTVSTSATTVTTHAAISTIESQPIRIPSPTILDTSPISLSPPPLPAKPFAYHSVSTSSFSSSSSSIDDSLQQQPQCHSQRLTASMVTDVSPPYHHSAQPPLPSRQKTVSQSPQLTSLAANHFNNTTIASASLQPSSSEHHFLQQQRQSSSSFHSDDSGYPPVYQSATQQHQVYSTSTSTYSELPARRDPAMLIVPPPLKEKQPATTTIMSMPKPVRSTNPFQYPATNPFAPTARVTSAPTSSAHIISTVSNPLGSYPPLAFSSQPTALKPDAKVEWFDIKDAVNNSKALTNQTTLATTELNDSDAKDDDDDGNESLLWQRNDGRMMAPATLGNIHPDLPPQQLEQNPPAMTDTSEEYDSECGSESDDDKSDDLAIDPFDIKTNDNVIIHQHTHSINPLTDNGGDPFADSFATINRNSDKTESIYPISTTMDDDQPQSVYHLDAKPLFQMNTNASTTAKVHDPLLKLATRPASTIPWTSSGFAASSVSMHSTTHAPSHTVSRPASMYQHSMNNNEETSGAAPDDDDDLATLDSDDIHPVEPTNMLRAGAPPNIQSIISQVTSEVPSNEFGYYQYQINEPGGEKELVEQVMTKVLPKRAKTDPDHRHITVPSVIENQRVWIRVHPTDTGKSLASRIHIVATYKTRKIISITTDKGRSIPLDDTPVFLDWAEVMQMQDGTAWKIEWTSMDHHHWEGPKEFLRFLKASLRSS